MRSIASREDVRRAIDAIEATTPSGIRDRAMMLLLASTGLRNRELSELELADIRWRTGEALVRRAKGHRDRRVPLPEETGAALARYVLHERPKTGERRVFLSHLPPVRPFASSGTVSRIVRVGLQCAGIPIQRGGAHLLRHYVGRFTRSTAERDLLDSPGSLALGRTRTLFPTRHSPPASQVL
jgi:integrase/recombinase XerD